MEAEFPLPENSAEPTLEQAEQASATVDAPAQPPAEDVSAETPATVVEHSKARVKAPTIGVFDSGIGGFTVAGAILKQRPDLNLVYFGDSLNLPYGGRSIEQLERFARSAIKFLLDRGADILAVGCNASNSALGHSELHGFGIPAFDLVSSTIDWLRARPRQPEHIALLATEATIKARYWERKLTEAFPKLEVTPIAAPELVPLLEAPKRDEAALRHAVGRRLAEVRESGATTLLYGCTHYPLLQSYMLDADVYLGFVDPGHCLAERLVASLPPAPEGAPTGKLELFSSLPGEAFYAAAERTFGQPARELTRMFIVNTYED